MKLICKDCGNIQNKIEENNKEDKYKNQICNRCGQKDMYSYNRVVNLYYRCSQGHYFKVKEHLAIYYFRFKQKITCPICSNHNLTTTTKKAYMKNTGRLKRIYEDQIQTQISL